MELEKLKRLRALYDEGHLTKEEYDKRKLQIIAGGAEQPTRPPQPSVSPVQPASHPNSAQSNAVPVNAALAAMRDDDFLKGLVTDEQQLRSLCGLVQDERSKTQEEVALALCLVFRLFGQSVALFKFLARHVVDSCASPEHVLAHDTFYKRAMAVVAREIVGRAFLQDAVGTVLSEVCTYDYMLDHTRADPLQEMAVVEHLFKSAQLIFDGIRKAKARFPREAHEAFTFLKGEYQCNKEKRSNVDMVSSVPSRLQVYRISALRE